MTTTSLGQVSKLTEASRFIAWSTIFIGVSRLMGWITGNVAPQTWGVSPIPMKADTAAGFVVAGAALLLLLPEPGSRGIRDAERPACRPHGHSHGGRLSCGELVLLLTAELCNIQPPAAPKTKEKHYVQR